MNCSLPDYPAPRDAEEIFNQMCRRNGLVVALVGNSGSYEGNGMVVAERNGMVESSVVDPHENDVECNGVLSVARRVISMEVGEMSMAL